MGETVLDGTGAILAGTMPHGLCLDSQIAESMLRTSEKAAD